MNFLLRALVAGFAMMFCLLPLANADDPREDEVPDEEQFSVAPNEADHVAERVIEEVEGPRLPAQPQRFLAETRIRKTAPKTPQPAAVSAPTAAPTEERAKADAHNAQQASEVAKQAAVVANKVAEHSLKVTGHAKHALKHALGALHNARVDSMGLDTHQKESLKKAEAHLREATKTADHGHLKKVKDSKDLQKEQMQVDLDKSKAPQGQSEKEQMLRDIQELRKELKAKNQDDNDIDKALDELEADVRKSDGTNTDELKAELERLRELVDSLESNTEERAKVEYKVPPARPKDGEKDGGGKGPDKEFSKDGDGSDNDGSVAGGASEQATPIEGGGIDIDTQMPYGELEPFGREDTAQELTEQSISESDRMVDQLERAEVAEEKRAIFRALTRLRGAALTSFDGVARAQTGNIDEYNQIHKWRKTHPLAHLADEESDVSKWAFPDNAD